MTVGFIFVAIVLSFFLLILAFILKDYIIGMLASLGIMSLGVYITIYNIENINNILTQSLATIFMCLGFYIFITGSIEKIKEYM